MSTNAKRCARAHLVFNLFGVLWMFFLLSPVLALINTIIPGTPGNPVTTVYHLSAFHTLFNLANTLLLVWFIPQIEQLVSLLVPGEEESASISYTVPWVPDHLPDARGANLINARGAVIQLVEKITTPV